MSIGLTRQAGILVVAVALLTITLVAFPKIAEAQDTRGTSVEAGQNFNQDAYYVTASSRPTPESAMRLVVRPGDSLWSISQQHLPSDASPGQIANEVEWIFEANRDQIGSDPNLIFPGQELLLPPVAEPDTNEPETSQAAANEPETNQAAASVPQVSEPVTASVPEIRQAATNEPETSQAAAPPAPVGMSLPEVSEPAANEPAAGVVPNTEPAFRQSNRQLVGLGTLALTFVLASLIGWKLYLSTRRSTKKRGSEIPMVHSDYYDVHPRFGGEAFASNNSDHDGIAETAEGRQEETFRGGASSPKRRPPSRGWATGVHNPQVRRYLRRPPRSGGPRSKVLTKKPGVGGSA